MSLGTIIGLAGFGILALWVKYTNGLKQKNEELNNQVSQAVEKQKMEKSDEEYNQAKQTADNAVDNYEQLKSRYESGANTPSPSTPPGDNKPTS